MLRSVLLGLFIALIVLIADQYTKWLAVDFLFGNLFGIPEFSTWLFSKEDFYPDNIVEITPYLNIVMVWNFGISFGILNTGTTQYTIILIVISLAICFILLLWLWNSYAFYTNILLGMIIGGALGNVVDRIRFGAVIDFIDVHVNNLHWPAFNLADSFITFAVVSLVLMQIFGKSSPDDIS